MVFPCVCNKIQSKSVQTTAIKTSVPAFEGEVIFLDPVKFYFPFVPYSLSLASLSHLRVEGHLLAVDDILQLHFLHRTHLQSP